MPFPCACTKSQPARNQGHCPHPLYIYIHAYISPKVSQARARVAGSKAFLSCCPAVPGYLHLRQWHAVHTVGGRPSFRCVASQQSLLPHPADGVPTCGCGAACSADKRVRCARVRPTKNCSITPPSGFEMCLALGSRYLWCGGTKPKHVSNPASKSVHLIFLLSDTWLYQTMLWNKTTCAK